MKTHQAKQLGALRHISSNRGVVVVARAKRGSASAIAARSASGFPSAGLLRGVALPSSRASHVVNSSNNGSSSGSSGRSTIDDLRARAQQLFEARQQGSQSPAQSSNANSLLRRPTPPSGSPSAPSPADVGRPVLVRFCLKYKTNWGESVKIIGSHPKLGAWSLNASPEMKWMPNDRWIAKIELPAGGIIEYKYVLINSETKAPLAWQQGGNSVLALWIEDKEMDVEDNWPNAPGAEVKADGGQGITREGKLQEWSNNALKLYQEASTTRMELERKTAENAMLKAEVAQLKMEQGMIKAERVEREAKLQRLEQDNVKLQLELTQTQVAMNETLAETLKMLQFEIERNDQLMAERAALEDGEWEEYEQEPEEDPTSASSKKQDDKKDKDDNDRGGGSSGGSGAASREYEIPGGYSIAAGLNPQRSNYEATAAPEPPAPAEKVPAEKAATSSGRRSWAAMASFGEQRPAAASSTSTPAPSSSAAPKASKPVPQRYGFPEVPPSSSSTQQYGQSWPAAYASASSTPSWNGGNAAGWNAPAPTIMHMSVTQQGIQSRDVISGTYNSL